MLNSSKRRLSARTGAIENTIVSRIIKCRFLIANKALDTCSTMVFILLTGASEIKEFKLHLLKMLQQILDAIFARILISAFHHYSLQSEQTPEQFRHFTPDSGYCDIFEI